jgi:hypothetical protein
MSTKIGAVSDTQAGKLEGIENIKPPIRLFYPLCIRILSRRWLYSRQNFKGGLDIKYGTILLR